MLEATRATQRATFSDEAEAAPSTRPGREIPKFERQVVNTLISQGWRYVPPKGGHAKLVPPDPTKPIRTVACTPSDVKGQILWLTLLRQSGAEIDTKGVSTAKVEETVSAPAQDADMGHSLVADRADINPILTHGAWWRPEVKAEPEPEPAPAPTPPVVERRPARRPTAPPLAMIHPDAQGANFSLVQAYNMIKQGYHINRVIQRTGWGKNWLADMVDSTGYYAPASTDATV